MEIQSYIRGNTRIVTRGNGVTIKRIRLSDGFPKRINAVDKVKKNAFRPSGTSLLSRAGMAYFEQEAGIDKIYRCCSVSVVLWRSKGTTEIKSRYLQIANRLNHYLDDFTINQSQLTYEALMTKYTPTTPTQASMNNTQIFHEVFMTTWNSGAAPRDYETYCRSVRQSIGLDQFFEHSSYILNDIKAGFDAVKRTVKDLDFQILLGSDKYLWLMLVYDGVPLAYGEVLIKDKVLHITLEGDEEVVRGVLLDIKKLYPNSGLSIISLLAIADKDKRIKESFMFPENCNLAKDYYYPWLKEQGLTMEGLFNEYLGSKKSVLLFIGCPGTGKSTLLRTLFLYGDYPDRKNYMVNNEAVLIAPGFVSWLSGIDDGALCGFEDSDTLVRSRENGNSQMSALLNAADGVIPSSSKMVISTNLSSLKDVDEALIRPGRCHRVLHFRKLTAVEAAEIRRLDGLPEAQFDSEKKYTLAEVLNHEHVSQTAPLKPSFGFSS